MSSDVKSVSNENQQSQLAKASDLQGQTLLPAVVESVLGSLGCKAFHNFEGSQLEIWRQVAIATGPDVIKPDAILGKEFKLQSFYCHQVQIMQAADGEFVDAIRCVLIAPDGTACGFASNGIASDLARIISAFGMGPYEPPLSIVIKQFRTRRGMNCYSIQPYGG